MLDWCLSAISCRESTAVCQNPKSEEPHGAEEISKADHISQLHKVCRSEAESLRLVIVERLQIPFGVFCHPSKWQ